MKLKLAKIATSSKTITLIVTLIFIIILGYFGGFLYKNIYQTITQSQEIIVMRAEVSPYAINIEKFNDILTAIDKKSTATNTPAWQEMRNPFGFTSINRPTTGGID
ncbi:MAG: hypothetical protein WC675_01730 [Patescibacteria group bacterium]|jgi:hypothetical protein